MVLHRQSIKPIYLIKVGIQSNKKWSIHQDQWDNTVITIKFPRAACRECQFRHLCTRSKNEPREINVRPKDEHLAIVKRRKQQQTKTWSRKYNQRAGVVKLINFFLHQEM